MTCPVCGKTMKTGSWYDDSGFARVVEEWSECTQGCGEVAFGHSYGLKESYVGNMECYGYVGNMECYGNDAMFNEAVDNMRMAMM